jgi:uncharacterized membrane protein
MMDKMLVAVFGDESRADEGSRRIRALDAEGQIDAFAIDIIVRDERGKVTARESSDPGALGRGVRLFTRSLCLALGAPEGFATAFGAETCGGPLLELSRIGIGYDFLTDVARHLLPGRVAVVAEIWEQWVMPVNSRLEAMGGAILRREREEISAAEFEREKAALEVEIAELEHGHARSVGVYRRRLEVRLRAVRETLRAVQGRALAELADARAEHEAKIAVVQTKLATSQGVVRASLEARLSERRAEHQRRSACLVRVASAAAGVTASSVTAS